MFKVLLIVLAVFLVFAFYCCLRVASWEDRQMERLESMSRDRDWEN